MVLCTLVGHGGTVYTNRARWGTVYTSGGMVVLCTPMGQGGTVYTSGAWWYCVHQ